MWLIMNASNSTPRLRHHRRYTSFTDITGDSEFDADEFGISGLTNPSAWWRSTERWAVWASEVDFRLDIAEAINAIAEEYADDIRGLIALYI